MIDFFPDLTNGLSSFCHVPCALHKIEFIVFELVFWFVEVGICRHGTFIWIIYYDSMSENNCFPFYFFQFFACFSRWFEDGSKFLYVSKLVISIFITCCSFCAAQL